MKKQILAIVLAVLMIAGGLPIAVYAQEEYDLYECEMAFGESAYAAPKDQEGASGGKVVGPIGMDGTAWFTMNGINVPADGDYSVDVVYTSCADGRTFRVGVGEAGGELVQAPALAGWTDLGTAQITLSLKEGNNTLKFYSVDSKEGKGDSQFGPDIDCIKVYVTRDTRAEDIAAVITLIGQIGEVTGDSYETVLPSIQAAEQAVTVLEGQYGQEVRAEVTNLDVLTKARQDYNTFYFTAFLPGLTEGYRLYECEAATSILTGAGINEQENASGGKTVGPIGQNGRSSCMLQGIIVPADGTYLVEVVYTATVEANGRTFRVGVNGEKGDLFVAPRLEEASTLGIVPVLVKLKAGVNTLLIYGEDTALDLGDGMWGPDIDCIRVYENSEIARAKAVENVVALIDDIDSVTEDNYLQCLSAILTAEAGMKRLVAMFGEEIQSEVVNYDDLLQARADFDFYSQPVGRDGYLIYECENLTYSQMKGTGVGASLSGAGVVNGVAPEGATRFTMTVSVEEAGVYEAIVGYFNGSGSDTDTARYCIIRVNGGAENEYIFPTTGSWDMPGQIPTAFELREGSNTFEFYTAPGGFYGPDFDFLGIAETAGQAKTVEGTRFGAQDAVLSGSAALVDNAAAYDGKALMGFGDSQSKASFPFAVESDGTYRLQVETASMLLDASSLTLTVKGSDQAIPKKEIPCTYSLGVFDWVDTVLELKAGEYSLEVSCASDGETSAESFRMAVSSIAVKQLTGEELQKYRANQIKSAINSIGQVHAGNYEARLAAVNDAKLSLAAYDGEYGEEGRALIPDDVRKTLDDAEKACARYADAKEKAAPVKEAIATIGEVNDENYKSKKEAIETAEKALNDYLAQCGEECKVFCDNADVLTAARKAYDDLVKLHSVKLGDVNGDTEINPTDALMVLQHTVELIDLNETQRAAADVNKDQQINPTDALKILQYTVELITEF